MWILNSLSALYTVSSIKCCNTQIYEILLCTVGTFSFKEAWEESRGNHEFKRLRRHEENSLSIPPDCPQFIQDLPATRYQHAPSIKLSALWHCFPLLVCITLSDLVTCAAWKVFFSPVQLIQTEGGEKYQTLNKLSKHASSECGLEVLITKA